MDQMLNITDLAKYCKNYDLAQIDPKRKELEKFLKIRIEQVKKINSNRNASLSDLEKANREQLFINSIIDLDTVQIEFMKSVSSVIHKCIIQYAKGINYGGQIELQNEFLRERIKTLEAREDYFIKLTMK